MGWAFGSGAAVGLIVGLAVGGFWLMPHLLNLTRQVVEDTSRAIRFPTSKESWIPLAPTMQEDPYADLEQDTELVPAWMGDEEDAEAS